MYKVHEILIPIRFCTLILQLILTIVVAFTMQENIFAGIPANATTSSSSYTAAASSMTICLILFYVAEGFEIIVIFSGMTIFLNKLSIIQIFFHSVGIILLSWFIFKQWVFSQIWVAWALGGLLPCFFEFCGLIFIRLHYRKVLKIT